MSSKGPKRKRYDSAGPGLQLDPAAKEQVHRLFEKKFTFHKPEDEKWMIRNLENQAEDQNSSKISENLSALKVKLNKLKDRLSDKDIIKWHTHTKFQHTSGGVMVELKTSYQIELCTQAWCKFYEILSQFPIVPEEILKGFTSVHLCEAPGAFISALNHFLYCKGVKAKWKWLATTLSPYYEGNSHGQMIDDDRFIRETLDKWYFGEDGSGNLMDSVIIDGLVTKATEHGDVNLVTADGSINCQDSPSEQELLVSELHYYETLAALKLLCKGGCFVIKVFTMFEEASITLMYILNCCFNQVDVIKPCTSKPGNSEVYVVCQDFIGQGQDETVCALQYIDNYNNGNSF
ncbi:cap-specific mRNA (nucleoside-2'-O-)-methyltransferase 2 [Patella vulgata]|uniref:cap-specific mRNA (nucleoside-2'-O-)-methyltransferase 2 n=1 Tax=Patella vulgata TaxID=6465 RepID=UPI00218008C7|nr:cap-specific mRNA (nucleoside-2'-O-)-methyltransferase 2 [Patella vulgata]